jgi:hypothetical protein
MKKNIILSFFLFLLVGVSVNFAQPDVKRENKLNSPYKSGESLTYEGKYKRFGFSFSIAEMTFKVSKLPETKQYFVTSEARSKGTLTKLFSFKFFQLYKSTVNPENLQILETTKRDEQGDRVRDSKAEFNYDNNKVTYVETDPKDATRPPRIVASVIKSNTQDIVSGVYLLRSMPLAVGKVITIPVSDSGLVYNVAVRVTAREKIKSIIGQRWCWRLEPEIFGDGKFIEQKGSLTIWMTDDKERIPVKAKLETKLGDVNIKLKEIEKEKASYKKSKGK